MLKHLVAATCVIVPGLVAVHRDDAQGPGHTPAACWKVSREYHEKLLFVRAWWGRIVATDLIFDVEKGRFVYREVLSDGFIAFQQWEAHGSPCVLPPGQFSK